MSVPTGLRRVGVETITLGRLAVPVVLLVIWQAAAMSVSEIALATPGASVRAAVDGLGAGGWMVEGLQRTLLELVIAYVLAVVAGIWIGVTLGLNEFWEEVFEPVVLGVYSIPKITLFPIFLFIFQLGMDSKIAFGWFHGVFPIAILTMKSMGTIRGAHLKVARSLLLSRWQTVREVVVPSILPGLVIGLRLGFNLTFLGIILGEMFAARAGLGYVLVQYMMGTYVDRMLAIILVLVIVATVVNTAFFLIEGRLGGDGEETVAVRM